ncbi:glycosyltransferase [Marinifilum flexuosum]|uniref:glycosyltransferase n=1 Tax=Marinifilum flexuosum TaxID=1117708 RepID=UPI002493F69F|nr:glycosyltransferase [Marinifilum flexuosum]
MAKVHFIWWGPCPSVDDKDALSRCIGMPIEVAKACPSHKIIFWCQEAKAFAFNQAIEHVDPDAKISVNGIESIKVIVGDLGSKDENKWIDDACENLVTLHLLKAYSAIKDLLSLIILYKEGGFYMDTTMMIKNPAALNLALASPPSTFKIVQIGGQVSHQVGIQTGVAIATGSDGRVEFMPRVELIDVWTIYSPIKDMSTELMFKSYVSRCNRMGLFPGGTTGNFDQIVGKDEMSGDYRNDLIGNLIIRSVYDGLIGVACGGDESLVPNFTWKAEKVTVSPDKNGAYALKDLGINKFHAGTWRHVL